MKKWINKFVFGTFIFVIALVTTISVNALTIIETTNIDDNYDDIADGTVIIGITKFEPNVVITALRASKATFNDVIFNYGTPGYNGVEIFYLLSGDWYNIDEDNDANLVEDSTVLESLNTSDIFYINNNEKMIEIPFSKTLEEGFEFKFYADNIEKNDEIVLENGKLKIPATVKEVGIYVKETSTGNEEKLDYFEKGEIEDVDFVKTSSEGTIAKDPGNTGGEDLTVNVTGSTITFDGAIDWYKGDSDLGRKAGNMVGVQITAPEVYESSEIENAKVVIGEQEYTWKNILDGEDYFYYYPTLTNEKRSVTVEITWVTGNKQVFTIGLAETATFEEAPKGTITKDPGNTGGENLTVNVTGSTITFDGAIDWYKGDSDLGRKAGNMVGVQITAPEAYESSEIENAKVVIGEQEYTWKNILDGEDYFYYYPTLTNEKRSVTVEITWETGNKQVFTIGLAETATFEEAPKGTITKDPGNTGGEDLTVNVTGSTITFDGAIDWYKGDSDLGRKAGNMVGVQITAPEVYESSEIENAKVVIGEQEYTWKNILDGEDYFYYYPTLTNEKRSVTVEITWETGNKQVFTIGLAETATFEEAPKGTITKDPGNTGGEDLTVNVTGSTITFDGAIDWYKGDSDLGRKAGNMVGVQITAPEAYESSEIENAKVVIGEQEYTWKNILDGEDYFYYYPTLTNEKRSVTVEITWETGNKQVFTIGLAETATFEDPSKGTITKDPGNTGGEDLTVNVTGSTITFDGAIDWYKGDSDLGRKAGNMVGVQITAPEAYESSEIENAKVVIGEQEYTWKNILDGEDYFYYYPTLTNEKRSVTVEITWETGNKQVFTIGLAETATFEEAPKGTITKDPGNTGGEDLTVNVTGSTITFDGAIDWYKGDSDLGRKAGNMVGVQITAPEAYESSEIENAKVVIGEQEYTWKNILDGEDYFYYYPTLTNEKRSVTVEITWETGNKQVFTIGLAETATFEEAPKGTIVLNNKYLGENLITSKSGNSITFTGTMPWYRDVLNDYNSGNFIGATITAPNVYNSSDLLNNASVSIIALDSNDEIVLESISLMADGVIFDGDTSFDFIAPINSDVKSISVNIIWETGNTQGFELVLNNDLVLEEKPEIYTNSISLNKETTNIYIGQKESLVATVLPENATNKNVIWTSSDTSVATVNQDGQVTSVAYGTATITVTTLDGKFMDTCEVKSIYRPINTPTISFNEAVVDMAGIFSRQVSPSLNTTGGSGIYTYHFAIYNASTGVLVGNTESSELDPTQSGFTLTIKSKTLAYRVDYIITDSVGNTKSGTFNIDAYES